MISSVQGGGVTHNVSKREENRKGKGQKKTKKTASIPQKKTDERCEENKNNSVRRHSDGASISYEKSTMVLDICCASLSQYWKKRETNWRFSSCRILVEIRDERNGKKKNKRKLGQPAPSERLFFVGLFFFCDFCFVFLFVSFFVLCLSRKITARRRWCRRRRRRRRRRCWWRRRWRRRRRWKGRGRWLGRRGRGRGAAAAAAAARWRWAATRRAAAPASAPASAAAGRRAATADRRAWRRRRACGRTTAATAAAAARRCRPPPPPPSRRPPRRGAASPAHKAKRDPFSPPMMIPMPSTHTQCRYWFTWCHSVLFYRCWP